MRRLAPWLPAAVLWTALVPFAAAAEEGRWEGPDGGFLPFQTDEEVLTFLHEASAERVRELTTGINRPLKVRLKKDGVEAHAVFRTVDVKKTRFETKDYIYVDFQDSYVFECAAYEMSRILGIDNVPPCVIRRLWGKRGSLQLWVEDAMTEEKRRREKIEAPSSLRWVRQQQTLRLFDALIRNFDRNQGNILIDKRWKMWFIDHTRSFHKSPEIDRIERITWCERGVWERLKGLDRETIEARMGDLLQDAQIDYVLERRDELVRHLEERIAAAGEDIVLFSASDDSSGDAASHPDYDLASSSDDIPEKSELEGGGGG